MTMGWERRVTMRCTRVQKVTDIFADAFSAALQRSGLDQWERMSDAERMAAVREQIWKMDINRLISRPLVEPD
jgi:hypothetical protein